MKKIITRFAPSPTGALHVGNARVALANWLYARKHNGQFILRFDDTDLERSKQEYKDNIEKDLTFLNISWDQKFNQSTRLRRYEEVKEFLLKEKKLYACYETTEELEVKRKFKLSQNLPPIYDRSALSLSDEQIKQYQKQGRRPHYRFLVDHKPISWSDTVKGTMRYHGKDLSDPIVIRADGSMTYMLCSVVDDIDYEISYIIRGEDHVSNTAIQIQMFESLNAVSPSFGHLSLVVNKEEKISKRVGGFEVANLKEAGFEPMAIASFFGLLGSSSQLAVCKTMDDLVSKFDIDSFSKSPVIYQQEDLARLNHKLLVQLSFSEVQERLRAINADHISESFWRAVSPNLQKLCDINEWWDICYKAPNVIDLDLDTSYLKKAVELLPDGNFDNTSWGIWTKKIAEVTGRRGRELFLPLRLALTGRECGPEMGVILTLIGREEVIRRLFGSNR